MDDVIIIGGGPAGIATAIQLRRHGIKWRLFEKSRPGGLVWNANWIENYPGFPRGISGPELAAFFVEQIGLTKITNEVVNNLCWNDGVFEVTTEQLTYQAQFVVVASGTKPKPLSGFLTDHDSETRIVYDLETIKDLNRKEIIVIGSGDIAFDYALNLAKENSVIILNHSDHTKCLEKLRNQAQEHQNIKYYPQTKIEKVQINPEGNMTVECSSPFGLKQIQSDYIVGAIGREPQIDYISSAVLIKAAEFEKKGILHFVGDVKNGLFRQAAIAVGDGVRAGMSIHHRIRENANESSLVHR
jgi:thioredoxin reductase (NADPH)